MPSTTPPASLYTPPRPRSASPLMGLLRCIWHGDGDLLTLMPADAYKVRIGPLGYSRRSIVIVNDPEWVRSIMTDAIDIFPKNDLMKGALQPLVGDSLFVSDGETWKRQRRMVEPAFSFMRITKAFAAMQKAVGDHVAMLDQRVESGEPFSLDFSMSHLTADIICRTVFSTLITSGAARDVFESFTVFERNVSNVKLSHLIFGRAWSKVPQSQLVLDACIRIREQLGKLIDDCLAAQENSDDPDAGDNLARAVMDARDGDDGAPFTRDELIDQLGVFFLAGHETTASVLTWAFFIIAERPEIAARMRAEIQAEVGDRDIAFEDIKKLVFSRNVFREALRLYPPLTFIPRVAAETTTLGGRKIKKGAMVMIAPWAIHRHELYWDQPDAFDPDRFSAAREKDLVPGAYLPFGQGPRVCAGATFAMIESTLILAELVRRFDFHAQDADKVVPVARLTTRPREEIMVRVTARTAP